MTDKLKRDLTIDIMKAIGIMLVVLGHTYHNSRFIYLFHMPLFFILSGATLIYSQHKYNIRKRFNGIIIPYLIFSFLSFLYWFILESKFRPVNDAPIFIGSLGTLPVKLQQFINIFTAENASNSFTYNVVLWFLPCLFIADIIYSRIKDKKLEFLYLIVLIIIYYLWIEKLPCLLWCSNLAILAVPLIALGYHSYKHILHFLTSGKSILKNIIFLIILICSIGIIIKLQNPTINMMANIIPPFYLFYPLAIIGCLMVLSLSLIIIQLFKQIKLIKDIQYVGENSLIIMCIHEPIKRIVLMLISKISHIPTDIIRDNLAFSLGITMIIIFICIPFIYIIRNYLPWMIGKDISLLSNKK